MYQYADEIPLNKVEILKRVSQEEIYQLVTGYLPQAERYVTSPLRPDKLAGAYYEWVKGKLLFKDWADPKLKIRDCFQFIMEKYNLNFNDCLIVIDDHFKLGIHEGNASQILYQFTDYSSRMNKQVNKSKRKEKNNDIETRTRKWNDYDKYYWYNRFGITKSNLIDDQIFPINFYKYFSRKRNEYFTVRPLDITYSLSEFQDGYKKIYRPLNSKYKWITNCMSDHVGNIDNLPIRGYKLIIEKSYKDTRIIINEGIRNVVWFQSENQYPCKEILKSLCDRFEVIIVLYDNDDTGIIGGLKLVNEINSYYDFIKATQVFIPDKKINDIGEMREKQGSKLLNQFLKTIY